MKKNRKPIKIFLRYPIHGSAVVTGDITADGKSYILRQSADRYVIIPETNIAGVEYQKEGEQWKTGS